MFLLDLVPSIAALQRKINFFSHLPDHETFAMPTSNLSHPPLSSVPAEMCELSELCELSHQDAMESLSVKGAMGGMGLLS